MGVSLTAQGSIKPCPGRHLGFRVSQLGRTVDTTCLMNRGAQGFEHSLVTSTRCSHIYNVNPDHNNIPPSNRSTTGRLLFEPLKLSGRL